MTITVIDQDGPELPQSLNEVFFTCPGDFDIQKIPAPNATDVRQISRALCAHGFE